MIGLKRARTAAGVPAAFSGAQLVKKNAKLLKAFYATNGAIKFDAALTLWKAAKEHLKKESNSKCAYCEADTAVVAHGDVEHFRPKSKYWWLAYCYDNYTYACQICNQSFKGDEFPLGAGALVKPQLPAAEPADLNPLAKKLCLDPLASTDVAVAAYYATESAFIVNPYIEDPEKLLEWSVDDVNKEVLLKAGPTQRAQEAFASAVEFLGLNREELKRVRYPTYEAFRTFRDVLLEPSVSQPVKDMVRTQMKTMVAGNLPFTGMLRYFVKEWGLVL
ncbi:hypothetical protein [Usitatibacter palustris]|uniref:TIGR02646 family protein n=1 Tax=Usitatibacter palustris TaxID=2732487 RepID=A0A6M4HBP1_9PROT|nr:hypothetical protein [Usitatibacter palustris]QJR15904.1 hypothetical protein DSM104440_02730 [Usitatibacter palustris]